MSVILKCDRCGKVIDDASKKGGTVRYCSGARFDPIVATDIDLCSECYTEFVEFLKGKDDGRAAVD